MAAELALFATLLLAMVAGCAQSGPVDGGAASIDAPSAGFTTTAEKASGLASSLQPVSTTSSKGTSNAANAGAGVADAPLIPREVLFGNPQVAQARLSPDGRRLSFLKPVEGVLNVWVGPVDDPSKAEPVTDDKLRGIRSHGWAYNSRYIVYTQDKGGDEDWHVYATNVATKETKDLTPIDGVSGELSGASERFPDELLVGINDRDPQLHDLYRVNLETGERKLVQENPGFAGLVTDDDFRVRMAINYTPQGGQVWLMPKEGAPGDKGYADWDTTEEFTSEDAMTSGPAGFDKTGQVLYFEDSRKRNTAGLFARDLATGEVQLVAEDGRADVGGVLAHPTEKTLQAVSFTYSRREWKVLDESIRPDLEFLKAEQDGEFEVTSRTLDDGQWTVAYILDNGPVKFFRYERPTDASPEKPRKLNYLFSSRDDLEGYPLVEMHTPLVKSRDGLELVCYLSLPPGSDPDGDGVPSEPVPMVLDVHGGPWSRDGWGFNSTHQWLANRGYAVLCVNYRGSTGFGKEFINAANGEWAGKMHDDLLDAVDWAVERGVAQRDKVAIMGGSYGGYATLVGLTFTPEVFACGVDIVGPSSLLTLIQNVPPYWMPFMPVMKLRVGDWTTEEGKAELTRRSPLTHVEKIVRPLLIGQGANDPRVTQLEADQVVAAMQEKRIPVTYALYPDEGHGFARPANSKSFNAVTEAFLAEHLGGRYEPVGADLEGSTLHVPAGVEGVPGLAEVLPAERQKMPVKEAAKAE
ncbi:MAG: S9 family peptidase [Lacipirellulaceae bacterium]